MKRWIAAAVCAVMAVSAIAAGPAGASDEKPLARMANGEVIAKQDLESYLDRRMDLRSMARNAWGVEEVVREMALTRVLNLEGDRMGITRGEREKERLRFDDVYGLAIQRKQEPACPRPANEQEARRYFDAHPQAFVVPAQARVQRVILPVSAQVDGQPSMDWLVAQARAITSGTGTGFDDVVKRAEGIYTVDPQGDLGWINLEGEGEIIESLRGAQSGQMLGPVRDGDFGYLFLVKFRRSPRQLKWDEAKSFAAARAESYCQTQGREQLRKDLFKKYGVEIDRAAIREFFLRANQPKQ